MAGIGFELQKLARSGGLVSQVSSMGHGAIIAAGPWIFTILSIGLITLGTENALGLNALAEFRVIIIYAFALSLVLTAPIVIITTRMVSDAIYGDKFEIVSHIYFAGLAIGAAVTALGTIAFYQGVFSLSPQHLVAGVISCVLVGMIWVSMALCGAVRDFQGITIAFLGGLIISVFGAFGVAKYGFEAIALIWTFNCGLTFTLFWLAGRILKTFPDPVIRPIKAIYSFFLAGGRYWLIALAAVISVFAIWIDKWIMWLGPAGEVLPMGFIHAPLYDSAMFVANLVIIPSLTLFIINLESDFFVKYQLYYADIKAHATLSQIKNNAFELTQQTNQSLWRIAIIQAGLCAILVLISPLLIETLNLQFRQSAILRLGVVGALFQFLFLAASSLLLFFNRNKMFLGLQITFFTLNAGLTYATVVMGEKYYGFGYLAAALISSLIALKALDIALTELNYFTFKSAAMANNKKDWLSNW